MFEPEQPKESMSLQKGYLDTATSNYGKYFREKNERAERRRHTLQWGDSTPIILVVPLKTDLQLVVTGWQHVEVWDDGTPPELQNGKIDQNRDKNAQARQKHTSSATSSGPQAETAAKTHLAKIDGWLSAVETPDKALGVKGPVRKDTGPEIPSHLATSTYGQQAPLFASRPSKGVKSVSDLNFHGQDVPSITLTAMIALVVWGAWSFRAEAILVAAFPLELLLPVSLALAASPLTLNSEGKLIQPSILYEDATEAAITTARKFLTTDTLSDWKKQIKR
ncbi:hypothetical protein BDN72DRAFT_854525 [Pluteus cervinus]|uniref:Uncharacterized protein n=1 Tax=Pluteus cervinus TaxID=181527 RepID=A0ACD3B6F7_9AGAR|nr:hypothetical protein BDN72DRAFT_854525 [Pluteus cervinus]